jgi:hypothetical protein
MEWHHYISGFFAGAVLANVVPHFVYGICGNKFPTPFSKPRGIGLSSPLTNMVWSLFNIIVGYFLLKAGPFNPLVFFAGVAAMGIMLSIRFQQKHKEE